MKETVVNFDNKKRVKTMLSGVLLIIACLAFAYLMVAVASRIRIFHVLGMIVCAGFGVFMLIGGIRSMRDKDKAGLILSSAGIDFKGTPNARKIGQIAWKDITSLSVGNAYGSSFVFLKLQNPDKYIRKISPQLRQNIISQGVGITNNELSIDFEEMKNLIEKYYHQFK